MDCAMQTNFYNQLSVHCLSPSDYWRYAIFFVFLNIIHNIQELELLGMYIVILFLHSLLGFIKL